MSAMDPSAEEKIEATGEDGLAGSFERALAIEMLESQALRTLALGAVFAIGSVFIAITTFQFNLQFGWPTAQVPLTVFAVASFVAVYEFGMRRVIRAQLRRGQPLQVWVWYASTCVEITAMSALIVLIQGSVSNPIFVLSTPPLAGYFLFIILSTLYLDLRLSLFTGGLAAVQYLLIVLFTFSQVGPDAVADSVFMTPRLYVAKAFILLLGGAGAAFVARELSRRQVASLVAVEERNREQRANALKSQFLADMSHEIRTPLNAVIGNAQLLEAETGITPDQRKAIEAIRIGGRHLLSIVNDVLDLSKIEAGAEQVAATRFDLTALLRELEAIFAARCAEKNLSWVFDADADPGCVMGDETKLRQVLTNIVGNAVKFTHTGHVALRVKPDGDGRLAFAVEDTGPGISETQLEEIFDPFAQAVQGRISGGTGLGLAIAKRYVELMGGRLSVKSAPGEGACFSFSLSLPQVNAGEAAVAPAAETRKIRLAQGQDVIALVADDVAANREVLGQMLSRTGLTVHFADNGSDALAMLARLPIDIAFLDIRMPGMTGSEVARRIAEKGRADLKLVAVSASALTHQRAEVLAAGFDDFIEKPVEMGALSACISRFLGFGLEPQQAPARSVAVDRSPVLPGELRRSLADAARRHNITDLKRHIAEVETLGDPERLVARQLRALRARYDMNAVLSALERLDHG